MATDECLHTHEEERKKMNIVMGRIYHHKKPISVTLTKNADEVYEAHSDGRSDDNVENILQGLR